MPSEGFDVVCFGAVDWSHTWQRPQQIASRLAAQGRVVYVDPIGLRSVLTEWLQWRDKSRDVALLLFSLLLLVMGMRAVLGVFA